MICKNNAIHMQYNSKTGFFTPNVKLAECTECEACMRICPANNQTDSESYIGNYLNLHLAHACDPVVRNQATSGGVINSLIRYLLEKHIVEAAVLVQHDSTSPVEASAKVITLDCISRMAQKPREYTSRYVSVPVLCEIGEHLRKYKRIAVVGTPCQMCALKKMPSTRIIKIGIACSGGMSYLATQAYKQYMKLPNAQMYYRGNGWPGTNSLVDGEKEVTAKYINSLFDQMFTSQIFKNSGCHQCKDHFAECADISFCDFWNSQEMANETEGNSCVIIRNEEMKSAFSDLVQNGYVEEVKILSETEILQSQINVLKAKKGNLKSKFQFKVYRWMTGMIFASRVYMLFNHRIYRKFCRIYHRICGKAVL